MLERFSFDYDLQKVKCNANCHLLSLFFSCSLSCFLFPPSITHRILLASTDFFRLTDVFFKKGTESKIGNVG